MRRVEGAVAAEKQLLDAAAFGAKEAPKGIVEGKVLQFDDAQRQLGCGQRIEDGVAVPNVGADLASGA